MNWCDVLQLSLEKGGLTVRFGPILLVLTVAFGAYFAYRFWRLRKDTRFHDVVCTKLRIANIGEVEIKPNHDTVRVAYQAWVELATRKAGVPFDDQHDVIAEVYASWYELFHRLRDLAKSIPAHRLRQCEDTRKLVEIMLRVLNEGLRPHLTQWQAKFRRWYEKAVEANSDKTPQEIQREYPEYVTLVADLKRVNTGIIEYAAWLREIAEGKQR